MKNCLLIIAIGILCSCSQGKKSPTVKLFFDIPAYFNGEAAILNAMHAGISKTLIKDSTTEIIKNQKVQWIDELAAFTQTDLNKPALIHSFITDTVQYENHLLITYQAKEASSNLKLVKLFMTSGVPDSIIIYNQLSNLYYESKETLSYHPKGNFNIAATNNPAIGKNIYFNLTGTAVIQ